MTNSSTSSKTVNNNQKFNELNSSSEPKSTNSQFEEPSKDYSMEFFTYLWFFFVVVLMYCKPASWITMVLLPVYIIVNIYLIVLFKKFILGKLPSKYRKNLFKNVTLYAVRVICFIVISYLLLEINIVLTNKNVWFKNVGGPRSEM